MRERDLFKKNYPEIKMSEEAKQKLFDLPNVEKNFLAIHIIFRFVFMPGRIENVAIGCCITNSSKPNCTNGK